MAVSVKVSGGDKWKKVLEPYVDASKSRVEVGIFENSKYDDGTPVALVGAVHEYGNPDVPARSFMRSTSEMRKGYWARAMAALLRSSHGEIIASLDAVGDIAAKDMQHTIEQVIPPPLQDETVEGKIRRGNNNTTVDTKRNKGVSRPELPLVDTGTMQEAISHRVVPA